MTDLELNEISENQSLNWCSDKDFTKDILKEESIISALSIYVKEKTKEAYKEGFKNGYQKGYSDKEF